MSLFVAQPPMQSVAYGATADAKKQSTAFGSPPNRRWIVDPADAVQSQDQHVIELQPFGPVNRHDRNGVVTRCRLGEESLHRALERGDVERAPLRILDQRKQALGVRDRVAVVCIRAAEPDECVLEPLPKGICLRPRSALRSVGRIRSTRARPSSLSASSCMPSRIDAAIVSSNCASFSMSRNDMPTNGVRNSASQAMRSVVDDMAFKSVIRSPITGCSASA
jgi:hypothetical protein